jgi:hypothetical protein
MTSSPLETPWISPPSGGNQEAGNGCIAQRPIA